MGPVKDKHGVRERFAKYFFSKNGRLQIKAFRSTAIYYIDEMHTHWIPATFHNVAYCIYIYICCFTTNTQYILLSTSSIHLTLVHLISSLRTGVQVSASQFGVLLKAGKAAKAHSWHVLWQLQSAADAADELFILFRFKIDFPAVIALERPAGREKSEFAENSCVYMV